MGMYERPPASPGQGSPPASKMDLLYKLVWLLAHPLEILSHMRFGVRYLSSLSIFTVLFQMIVVNAVMGLILMVLAVFTRAPPAMAFDIPFGTKTYHVTLFQSFTWLVFIVGTCHQVSIRRRIMRDEMGYTYDSGRPFMFVWRLVSHDEWTVKRFWEPGVWCFVSYVLQGVDQVLSWYLFVSSFALTAKANLIYYHMRSIKWDLHDQAMIGGYLATYFDERRDRGESPEITGPVRESPPDPSHAELLRPSAPGVLRALGLSVPAEGDDPAPPEPGAQDRGPVPWLQAKDQRGGRDGGKEPSLSEMRDAPRVPRAGGNRSCGE